MPKMKEEFTERIYLNPRIGAQAKREFERNMFEQKQAGVRFDMSKLFRSFVDKFNEDPDKMMKILKLKK